MVVNCWILLNKNRVGTERILFYDFQLEIIQSLLPLKEIPGHQLTAQPKKKKKTTYIILRNEERTIQNYRNRKK